MDESLKTQFKLNSSGAKSKYFEMYAHIHTRSQITLITLICPINTHYKTATNPCMSFCRTNWAVIEMNRSKVSLLSLDMFPALLFRNIPRIVSATWIQLCLK